MRTLNVYSYLTIGFLEGEWGRYTFLAFEQGGGNYVEFSNSKKLIRMRLKKPGETEIERKTKDDGGFQKFSLALSVTL